MTVSRNGQVSIPAGTRARWKTRQVLVVDLGDRVVMRPVGDEVIDHLVRLAGADEEEASLDLAQLRLDDAVVVDGDLAAAAGRLRARRYHRTRCPVSLADCVAAEAARRSGRPLATADPALLDACHHEQIDVTVLAGSDGSRWSPPPTA